MDAATLEALIVKELRKASKFSRRDLAEQLGIAKSTAGRRIDSMIERGIVREDGIEDRREIGRPRRLLALQENFGNFVGFDFDACNLYIVLIDFAGNSLVEDKIQLSSAPSRGEVLQHLREQIASFRHHESGAPLLGIGIGVPGPIRQDERIALHYSFISDWKDIDLSSELGLDPSQLHIENNTKAIALGEYWLGPFHGTDHLLCMNVRTGISVAMITNGKLIRGRHGLAGEIRGWQVGENDSLENVATVRAVTEDQLPDSARWSRFIDSCKAGDETALATLTRIAKYHGEALARIIPLLDPELIFLATPFTQLESIYLDRVNEAISAVFDDPYFSMPPIHAASLGPFAGAHGAAALAAIRTPLV